MYYDEFQQTPLDKDAVMRTYGVNPENDAATALRAGIYPVIDCPEGYSPTHYVKEGQAYRAVPHEFSDAERSSIYQIQEYGLKLKEAADKLKTPDTTDLVEGLN